MTRLLAPECRAVGDDLVIHVALTDQLGPTGRLSDRPAGIDATGWPGELHGYVSTYPRSDSISVQSINSDFSSWR